jgi:ABC-type transport system substrate-binding protein
VVDDATIEVTLSRPYNFFLSYLGSFVWNVVDPDAIAEFGETDFVTHDAGSGPWRLTEYDPSTQFVMEPNTNHYNGNSPSIVKIICPIMTGPTAQNTALNLYKADQAVLTDVPLSLLGAVKEDPVLSQELVSITPSASTRSLAMDFTKPPFDDVRVRRAFGMAIDREKWCNEIWQGTFTPTDFYTPTVVMTTSTYQPPEGIKYDPDGAKALLAEAGYPDGAGMPEITLYWDSTAAPDEINRWRAFLQMFKDTLNVDIALDSSMTLDQIQDLQVENSGRQFDIWWWVNITETPQLMSEVFRTDSPYMTGVFNWKADLEAKGGFDPGADAATFDELMAQADVEQDQETRESLYRQGEELVLKNAVYVPMGNGVPMFVEKPYLKNTRQGPWTLGSLPIWFDKEVVVVKH